FFFSSRGRHTRVSRDWSSDVCSSDLDRVPDLLPLPLALLPLRVQGQLDLVRGVMSLADQFDATHVGREGFAELRVFGERLAVERSEERRVGKEWRGLSAPA